jgi:hypothetical protein
VHINVQHLINVKHGLLRRTQMRVGYSLPQQIMLRKMLKDRFMVLIARVQVKKNIKRYSVLKSFVGTLKDIEAFKDDGDISNEDFEYIKNALAPDTWKGFFFTSAFTTVLYIAVQMLKQED